jgi:hypothetical protein
MNIDSPHMHAFLATSIKGRRVYHGKDGGWIGDGIIDSSSPRLADVRARRTKSDPQIRARPSVGMGRLNALEVCTSHAILMFKHILRFALLKHLSQML